MPGRLARVSTTRTLAATAALLVAAVLPAGWRHATGEQHLGIPRMCDVTREPPSLPSAQTQRFTKGHSGPFVIQYSFVSADQEAAADRVDEFVAAAARCTTYSPVALADHATLAAMAAAISAKQDGAEQDGAAG